MTRRTARTRGFTIIEMAVVLLVLGILSGLALPNLRRAVAQADAARVLSDVATIRNAGLDHLVSEGRFPRGGRWGETPEGFEGTVGEDLSFTYKGIRYLWFGLHLPFYEQGRRNLGILMVDLRRHPEIALELEDEAGPSIYWSPYLMYFLFWA